MSTKKNTKKIIKIEVTKKAKPAKKPSKAPATKKKSAEKPAKETIEIEAPTEFIDMLTPKKPAKKTKATKAKKPTKKPVKKPAPKKTSKKEDNVTQLPPASDTVYDNSGKEPYKKPELAAKGNGYKTCPNNEPTGCCAAHGLVDEAINAGNFITKIIGMIKGLFGKK
jgi:hypothetical protein